MTLTDSVKHADMIQSVQVMGASLAASLQGKAFRRHVRAVEAGASRPIPVALKHGHGHGGRGDQSANIAVGSSTTTGNDNPPPDNTTRLIAVPSSRASARK